MTVNSPRLPRIPPRFHHKKPSTNTPFFQNTPQKHQQKQQNPGLRQGPLFSSNSIKNP
jgi:hypothetical protein